MAQPAATSNAPNPNTPNPNAPPTNNNQPTNNPVNQPPTPSLSTLAAQTQQLLPQFLANSNNNNNNNNNNNADDTKLNDQLSSMQINNPNNNMRSGIDDRMQGDIHITHQGVKKTNPYESLNIKDFPSLNILRDELLDGCAKMNFIHPSKIQATAIPICLSANNPSYPNLIAQAHHGSGKTATFTLIMLARIDENISLLQGLCITHSRELANQTYQVIKTLSSFINNMKICLALPKKQIPNPWDAQICIGTPGTLIDKIINPIKRKPFNKFLMHFKILVIDEADEFLKAISKKKKSKGNKDSFGSLYDQLKRVVDNINKAVIEQNNSSFQTLLFSATYPQKVKKLATDIAPNAFVIRLEKKQVQLDNIKTYKIECNDDSDKFNTLLRVISLGNIGQMIVFVNTVQKAEHLYQALTSKNIGIACSVLYGRGMNIDKRDQTMSEFRKGQTTCLIASNVIARGIDVPQVGLVVNFEIPLSMGHDAVTNTTGKTFDSETFMHRVGRTGRFGTKGVCINLLSKNNVQENNMLDAITKEYSLNITPLSNDYKTIKDVIAKWLSI